MPDKPHHLGHRKRLRERFLKSGADSVPDYELLEVLLFAAQPRRDMKPVAKRLLNRFDDSLAAVLAAEPRALAEIEGVGEAGVVAIKSAQAAALRLMREEAAARPVIASWDKLLAYCRAAMVHDKREQFRLLFLDRKNRLIADEVQHRGTVDHTTVYPREVVKRALELGASSLIMVHNHPSGDPTPSRGDIEMTREVVKAVTAVGLTLHDHVVVGRDGSYSFKSQGLL